MSGPLSLICLEESLNIQAPREVVFELIGSSENWKQWTPVSKVDFERENDSEGVGEIRVFRLGPNTIREQIVENEPDHRYSYILLSGIPVDDYRVRIDLKPEFGGCTVTWETVFRPRFRGTGKVLAAAIGNASRKMLRGLAIESETRSLASGS